MAGNDVVGVFDLDGRAAFAAMRGAERVALPPCGQCLFMHGGDTLGFGEKHRAHNRYIALGHDVAVAIGGVDVARVDAVEIRLDATRLDFYVFLHGGVTLRLRPGGVRASHGRASAVGADHPTCMDVRLAAVAAQLHVDTAFLVGAAYEGALVPNVDSVGKQAQEPLVEHGSIHVGEAKRARLLNLAIPVVVAEVHPCRVEHHPMGKWRDAFKEALSIFVEHAAAALAARQRRALHEERPQAGLCRLASRHNTGRSCSHHNKVVVC